jgi:hypothetical protein
MFCPTNRSISIIEGLLLLISLTQNNAEIQKIIAFENAFDRLIGIILEEGASEGGIIVQDCLNLTLNLLRYNVSNQNLFRESSCIQRIPSLLISHSALEDDSGAVPVPLTHEANTWVEQKVINATLILELVRILVVPNSPNTKTNQVRVFCLHVTLQLMSSTDCYESSSYPSHDNRHSPKRTSTKAR